MDWEDILELKAKNYKSFNNDEYQGFDGFKTINLIVGRNNSGKSTLLDLVELVGQPMPINVHAHERNGEPKVIMTRKIHKEHVDNVFAERTGGAFEGNHKEEASKLYVDNERGSSTFELIFGTDTINYTHQYFTPDLPNEIANARYKEPLINSTKPPEKTLFVRRLAADRDIKAESKSDSPHLDKFGAGASAYLYHYMRRDSGNELLVKGKLLSALNEIFDPYSHFETIDVKELGNTSQYEIYVYEKDRQPVKLSDSGSGFKTVFLVLINLLLVPDHVKQPPSKFAFCFEEIENNLHPGLQRKLISYIKKYARESKSHIFITTHSSAILDAMQTEDDVQIIHVKHNGKASKCSPAITRIDNNGVLDDLDIRASDILQANSIIWVEGPTDRLYINKFIDIYTKEKLIEGIHYQILFYGGRLLSHLEAGGDGDAIDILKVNRHAIMVMDSDHSSTNKKLTPGKKKMKAAMNKINAPVWITKGREIENYIKGDVIARKLGKANCPDVGRFTKYETYLNKINKTLHKEYTKSKATFAENTLQYFQEEDLGVLDLQVKMKEICGKIAKWNGVKLKQQ